MHLAVQYSPVILAISIECAPGPTFNAKPLRSATLVHASVHYVIGEFVERTQSTAHVAGQDSVFDSEGGKFQFEDGRKGKRFEIVPGVGIGSSQVHVLFNIQVVGDGLKELCWKLVDGW